MISYSEKPISVGQIKFVNALPVNYPFEKWKLQGVVFSSSYPSMLNQLMGDRMLEVSAVSAVEYFRKKNQYALLDNICIACDTECGSVVLYSNFEIEDLYGKTIAVPYTSESSVSMLKIILDLQGVDPSKVRFVHHKYELPAEKFLEVYDAVLYIGDQALKSLLEKAPAKMFDMGTLWQQTTGYPAVFAVWIADQDWAYANKDSFEWIKFLLGNAVDAGLDMYFNDIIKEAQNRTKLDEEFLSKYFSYNLKYKFNEARAEGLNYFENMWSNLNNKIYL